MKNVIKFTVSAAAILGGALVAAPAMAQGAPTVSGNVAIVTDYRFRGVSFSGNEFAVQGGIDLGWESGFYVGTWASSIQTLTSNDEIELDLYAGYGGDLGSSGLTYDFGVVAYTYPGTSNFSDTWYPEIYASVSGAAGVAGWTLGAAYAPDVTDALGQDNMYFYGDLEVPFGESPFYAMAHVGYEDGAFGNDKIDYLGGIGASFAGIDLSVAYVDADNGVSDAVVLSIGSSW
jgi:uncharacterized protein (TIGR02001 family)